MGWLGAWLPTDLCAYLTSLEPHLKEVGPIGASAQMDEVMKKSCPDVYKALLKDLDTKTFQEALG